MNVKFELGKKYSITKNDGSKIVFEFIGGNPPKGLANGTVTLMSDILSIGFINWKEI